MESWMDSCPVSQEPQTVNRQANLSTVRFRPRGRCYGHNFLRFLSIFCEKIGVLLKIQFLQKRNNRVKTPNLCQFFFRKYFKNHNIGSRFRRRCWRTASTLCRLRPPSRPRRIPEARCPPILSRLRLSARPVLTGVTNKWRMTWYAIS
jgi:hypothetical protein